MLLDYMKLFDFMRVLDKFALTYRIVKMSDGTYESDAAHTVKLCFLVLAITPYLKTPVNIDKMLKMALIHDLPEAETGDIGTYKTEMDVELKEHKKQSEIIAMQEICSLLPDTSRDEIYQLFMEYEEKQSREALIVNALDKLEAIIQANFYADGDVRHCV